MSLFEKATRQKLRFTTTKGSVTTEDLWDLPLTQLNAIAKSLNKTLKEQEEEDFLNTVKKDTEFSTKFEVVLCILETKKKENEDAKQRASRKQEKEKLLSILSDKQDEELKGLSATEIKQKIAAL